MFFKLFVAAVLMGIAGLQIYTIVRQDEIMATIAEADAKLDEILVFLEADAVNDAELASDIDALLVLAQDDENIPQSFVDKLGLVATKAQGGTDRSRAMADKFPVVPPDA